MRNTLPSCLDSPWSRLSELLALRTGLHFPPERWDDLERGIASAAPIFGMPDAESCAHWLNSAPLTRNEVEMLASHLTVGETYFFRDAAIFDALRLHIFPELLRAREHLGRRLRIWSAGCCTGEEPYSVAMLLDQLIPHPEDWNATILATDINPVFLRKAVNGVYGKWSFRALPTAYRERYFTAGKKSLFDLQPRIRNRVTFASLNLADDAYPSHDNNTSAMDVIFCRNVLMYFTQAQAKKAVEKLHRSLADGGWLIVSPAETSSVLFSRFTPVYFPGAVFYQKHGETQSSNVATAYPATALPAWPVALPPEYAAAEAALEIAWHDAPLKPERPTPEADGRLPSTGDSATALSKAARSCANQGKLAEAVEWCEKAIAADKLNHAHLYLLAAIQQEQAEHDLASQSLVRALYLDPDFILAHFALGNLRLAQGRRPEAARHFENTLELLHRRPRDESLPESEGLSTGRLIEIVTSVLASSSPREETSI